jgi:hypothetical protein
VKDFAKGISHQAKAGTNYSQKDKDLSCRIYKEGLKFNTNTETI